MLKRCFYNHQAVNAHTNEVEQTTHYYPYGGVIGNLSSNQEAQKYKYSGKALAAIEKIDNTYQISHSRDEIVSDPTYRSTQGEIEGAFQINSSGDSNQSHTIYSFSKSVEWLKSQFNGLLKNE